MKRPIYIYISIISMVSFLLEFNSVFSIGKIVNYFFPYQQSPENAMPGLWMVHDIYFMLILVIIFFLSLILFFIHKKK